MFYVSCVSYVFASIHCYLVVTCWERADLLALVGDVYCIFVTFHCGILGQVWYLIVSSPDFCCLSYFLYLCLSVIFLFDDALHKLGYFHSCLTYFLLIPAEISQ